MVESSRELTFDPWITRHCTFDSPWEAHFFSSARVGKLVYPWSSRLLSSLIGQALNEWKILKGCKTHSRIKLQCALLWCDHYLSWGSSWVGMIYDRLMVLFIIHLLEFHELGEAFARKRFVSYHSRLFPLRMDWKTKEKWLPDFSLESWC